jgi:hypothetical protein
MSVNIGNIVKVYSGKCGCMCGCNGKYSYTADGAENFGPGYDVSDSVNERSVKIIAKKVLSNPNANFTESKSYVFVEDRARNKIQVVYFKDAE